MKQVFRPSVSLLSLVALALWPTAPRAHPHIFIDAGLVLVLDAEGRIAEARSTWVYDELYSLILLEDHGLDPDRDMILTETEIAGVLGFDLDWTHGFEGGLHLARGGADLSLGAPTPVSLSLTPEGRIVTVHTRPVTDRAGAGAIEVSIHDPEFYAAFEMTGTYEVEGADCTPELIRADLDAAYETLEAALEDIGGAVASEDNFPAMGALFADRVIFECAG